jgi:Family of unknown function (DUF695)
MPGHEITIDLPEPHYTLFNSKRDGLPEVIVVNDALLAFRNTEIFPWYLCITLEVKELIENGMPSSEESELLFNIGDLIESAVLKGLTDQGAENAMFLARSTWNEVRELMFQVHDPEVTHSELQKLLQSREWEREWSYRMEHDPEWEKASFVFQLFPKARGCDA